jgi:iron complex transport system substrate-binding protein
MREPDDITDQIIAAALRIHRRTGPGLLESVYETLVAAELRRRGFGVERQKAASLDFDGFHFEQALRLDLLVERTVAVEIKSVEQLKPVHKAQLLTYLRLLDLPVGLLINFGGRALKDGLVRVVNDLPPSPSRRIRNDRLDAGSDH